MWVWIQKIGGGGRTFGVGNLPSPFLHGLMGRRRRGRCQVRRIPNVRVTVQHPFGLMNRPEGGRIEPSSHSPPLKSSPLFCSGLGANSKGRKMDRRGWNLARRRRSRLRPFFAQRLIWHQETHCSSRRIRKRLQWPFRKAVWEMCYPNSTCAPP